MLNTCARQPKRYVSVKAEERTGCILSYSVCPLSRFKVKARGAELIIITDKAALAEGLDEDPIVIPTNGAMTALGAVLPLQLIAYELAMLRGINPDTPRNLAKAVTVD